MREIRAFERLRKSGLREQCLNRLEREICCPAREIRIPNVHTCVVQSHLVPALEKYVLFVRGMNLSGFILMVCFRTCEKLPRSRTRVQSAALWVANLARIWLRSRTRVQNTAL